MKKSLWALPVACLMLFGCSKSEPGTPYAGPELNTYSELTAGKNGEIFTIAGYVTAVYGGSQKAGIFIANGDEAIQLYQYELPEGTQVGDLVYATGARSAYDNGRVVELARTVKNGEGKYEDCDGAAIGKLDITGVDKSTLPFEIKDPVDYTFDAATWANATSSTTPADWQKVSGRKVTVTGTVKADGSGDATAHNTVKLDVNGVEVAVYVHKTNDAEAIRNTAAAVKTGETYTVTGTVGSYKGATQIVGVQSFAK